MLKASPNAPPKPSPEEDEEGMYCKNLAQNLRTLDKHSYFYIKHSIGDMLYKAQVGTLLPTRPMPHQINPNGEKCL